MDQRTVELTLTVTIDANVQAWGSCDRVDALLRRHPGNHAVRIVTVIGTHEQTMHPAVFCDGFDRVLLAALDAMLGAGYVEVAPCP